MDFKQAKMQAKRRHMAHKRKESKREKRANEKANEKGKGERRMKTANVKWGRGKREATGKKSKCKR